LFETVGFKKTTRGMCVVTHKSECLTGVVNGDETAKGTGCANPGNQQ